MKICNTIIILLWMVVSLISSTLSRRNSEIIQKRLGRNGEFIASDNIIQKYEREHQQLYEQKPKDGNCLLWPNLYNKNLSKYCRGYLQNNMPSRKNEGVIGLKMETTLQYDKEKKSMTSKVVVIQCRVQRKSDKSSYYITRAPETNCVYTLKCNKCSESLRGPFVFTIINKYCDFEGIPLSTPLNNNSSLKRRRVEVIKTVNERTGQPVANDEYLLQFEMEHQELLKSEANGGNQIKWPDIMDHHNLDSYCKQYVRVCAPRKSSEGVTGKWNPGKLHYQKLEPKKDINVTIVTFMVPGVPKCCYFLTRAPESNCAYALLQSGCNAHFPFVIIFKHCNFEDPNDHQNISEGYDILDKNIIPKTEAKEEMSDISDTMQFFQKINYIYQN